jgi:hypothetical protein
MMRRSTKLLLILLIPALVYGALKGFLYYKAKRAMDDIVVAAANQADVRYADIGTDLRGAVTVSGISIQPHGYSDRVEIDALRVASDDPLFFYYGAQWQPGKNAPPPQMSFAIDGLHVPLSADMLRQLEDAPDAASTGPCEQGLQIDAALLQKLGFAELSMDLDGHYRVDEVARTLNFSMNMELRDIESLRLAATLSDLDVAELSGGRGAPPNLAELDVSLRVSPEFGRKALKLCAMGSELSVQDWSNRLADMALQDSERQGLKLGTGLADALREFYRSWGEFRLRAAPEQPVGPLSLMVMPPEQLVDALSLQLSLNDKAITDTSFTWQRPQAPALAALFGNDDAEAASKQQAAPQRILVRRQYEPVAVQDIAKYIDSQILIKPRGLPPREGVLKSIKDNEAEVEQSLQGGKFTAYVPLNDVESLQALVQHEVPR